MTALQRAQIKHDGVEWFSSPCAWEAQIGVQRANARALVKSAGVTLEAESAPVLERDVELLIDGVVEEVASQLVLVGRVRAHLRRATRDGKGDGHHVAVQEALHEARFCAALRPTSKGEHTEEQLSRTGGWAELT